MVNIQDYLNKESGSWLKAVHVKNGDMLTVLDEGFLDNETFEKPYLCLTATLERTGETYKIRMGVKNVARIAETLGVDTSVWVGQALEVVGTEQYAGLGQKGILFRGVITKKQKPLDIKTA